MAEIALLSLSKNILLRKTKILFLCHAERSEESDVITSKTTNPDSSQVQNDKFQLSISNYQSNKHKCLSVKFRKAFVLNFPLD